MKTKSRATVFPLLDPINAVKMWRFNFRTGFVIMPISHFALDVSDLNVYVFAPSIFLGFPCFPLPYSDKLARKIHILKNQVLDFFLKRCEDWVKINSVNKF